MFEKEFYSREGYYVKNNPRHNLIDFIPLIGLFTDIFRNCEFKKPNRLEEITFQQKAYAKQTPYFALYQFVTGVLPLTFYLDKFFK